MIMKKILFILLFVFVSCDIPENDFQKIERINNQLYRVYLKMDDGFEIKNKLFREIIETESTVTLAQLVYTNEYSFVYGRKPQIKGVLFERANIDSFSYRDIRDSLKYYWDK